MTIMQDMEKEYILQGFDDLSGIGERKSLSLETGFVLDRMTTLWICLDEVWITKRSSNLPTLVC